MRSNNANIAERNFPYVIIFLAPGDMYILVNNGASQILLFLSSVSGVSLSASLPPNETAMYVLTLR